MLTNVQRINTDLAVLLFPQSIEVTGYHSKSTPTYLLFRDANTLANTFLVRHGGALPL